MVVTEVLSLLKFVTDKQTRDTVQSIAQKVSSRDKDWIKSIRRMSGRFAPSDIARIDMFANSLIAELKRVGLSDDKIRKFYIVFSELVHNAFKHGCKGLRRCKIAISCIYSPWFVEIEVQDQGKGFDLEDVLQSKASRRSRPGRSGLQLVRDLVDNLTTNAKGNRVVALITGGGRIAATPSIERYGGEELCIITLREDDEWHFLAPNWQVLQQTLDRVTQEFIMVTWGDAKQNPYDTACLGGLVPVITGCRITVEKVYAFVRSFDWILQDLQELSSANLRFFENEHDARNWLLRHMKTPVVKCTHCQLSNRVNARFCRACGWPLKVPDPIVRCTSCRTENRASARFCQACGRSLASN